MLPSDNPDNVLQVDEEKVSLLPHTHMTHLREYLNSSLLQDRHALRFPKSLHPETGNKGHRVVWVENPLSSKLVRVEISSDDVEQALGYTANSRASRENNIRQSKISNQRKFDNPFEMLAGHAVDSVFMPSLLKWLFVPYPKPYIKKDDESDSFYSSFVELDYELARFFLLFQYFFLVTQGMLAGFCFVTLYLQNGEGSQDYQFLLLYQPFAGELRRFFYLLASISAIGSCSAVLSLYSHRRTAVHTVQSSLGFENTTSSGSNSKHSEARENGSGLSGGSGGNNSSDITDLGVDVKNLCNSRYHASFDAKVLSALRIKDDDLGNRKNIYGLSIIVAIMYCIIYALCVIIGGIDALIAIKAGDYGVNSSLTTSLTWAAIALQSSTFKSLLSLWRGLDRVRFVLCVLAWLLGCRIVIQDTLTLFQRSYDFLSVLKSAQLWRFRALQMTGSHIESMNAEELSQLKTYQELGLSRSENLLRLIPINDDE